jgi:hypothetical protein
MVSWLETGADGGRAFRCALLDREAWSEPRVIAEGPELFLNWADFPTVCWLGGDRFAAHWLQRPSPSSAAYGIRVAFSSDAGRTWKTAFASTRAAQQGYEGFLSFASSRDQLFACFLDHSEAVTQLRVLRFAADGAVLSEEVVDPDVCSCCQTTIQIVHGVPTLACRDHTDPEIRDISLSRWKNRSWTLPRPVHADNWKVNACPVNGPSLAANSQSAALAWCTAAPAPSVYVSLSRDGGESFAPPIVLDRERPMGRVSVAGNKRGFAVAWLARAEERAELRVAQLDTAGRSLKVKNIARLNPGRSSGFPRLAACGNELYAAWTGDTGVELRRLRD